MECMCAQMHVDLSLYSHPKEVLGNGAEPMLTPRENPLYWKKIFSEEDQTHNAASSRTVSVKHYQRAISACKWMSEDKVFLLSN